MAVCAVSRDSAAVAENSNEVINNQAVCLEEIGSGEANLKFRDARIKELAHS